MNNKKTIVPVLVLESIDEGKKIADVVVDVGLTHLEITLRTPQALTIIKQIKRDYPMLHIGAGTVINKHDADCAIDNGADFLVSPGITTTLIEQMRNYHSIWYGGVGTLSEVLLLREYGINQAKLFPAEVLGGIAWLKSAQAVIPTMSFFPTGGINLANISDYLSTANVTFIGGTWLASRDALNNRNFTDIENNFKQLKNLLDSHYSTNR